MSKPATYFNVTASNTAGRNAFVVKGERGELRSSFPDRQLARLHCAQLNAAFAIGQAELLRDRESAS